jgi:5'-nucleotidase
MNKKVQITFFLACLCGFWLSSCAPKIQDESEIVILSTTDIHGHFEYLAKFSAFVKETKSEHKNVIVADAGDRFTGNPYNDLHEKKQFPIVDLLNFIGVDVMTIGNHEFDFGVDLLNERIGNAKGAVISANIKLEGSGLRGITPYHIIKKGGIKIAFLGLTNVDKYHGKPAVLPDRVAGIEFYDPIEAAVRYRHLRKKSHVFVALTHIGINEDYVLADSMPELNLIISGHSHILLEEPLIHNNVLITQSGKYASHIGKTTILLKKGVVSQVTNEMIDLNTWDGVVDPVIVKKIREYESNPFSVEPFAMLQYEIPDVEQLTYMVADAALTLPGVDFSVINYGGIRISNLAAGPISYDDIFRISPFNNYLVIVGLKPAEIRKFIEAEFHEKQEDLISPAGFKYAARKTSDGRHIKVEDITLPNGRKMDETKTYYLALNSYLFSRWLSNHADYAIDTEVFVVDNIMDYLRINPNADYRNRPTRATWITK